MIFKKRLNNNVVIALDENGQEKILCGKGLGFQMKEQDTVEEGNEPPPAGAAGNDSHGAFGAGGGNHELCQNSH